ncbi:MAG: hypothetical protein II326_05400, partial [Clostridia bacterium]|nr:hypothetical protein [Clostridia bacterium]
RSPPLCSRREGDFSQSEVQYVAVLCGGFSLSEVQYVAVLCGGFSLSEVQYVAVLCGGFSPSEVQYVAVLCGERALARRVIALCRAFLFLRHRSLTFRRARLRRSL